MGAKPWPRALALCCLALAAPAAWALPSYEEVRSAHRPSETLLLSREGEVLQRLRTDASVRRGQWVALADISPALRTALVLGEDRRFYEHSGVDWAAVSSAAWGRLWHQRTRGASTISMQLAGLVDGDWQRGPGGRTLVQKLGQSVAAQVLDRRWRKDQILEAYLNLVPFRGELVGIDALSRTLFGKAAHGLDAREAAVAAVLVRAPNAPPQRVAERACALLQQVQQQSIDCDALALFVEGSLRQRQWPAAEGVAPHFARRVLAETAHPSTSSGRTDNSKPFTLSLSKGAVRSTLSAPLQRHAVRSLQRHLRELQGRNVEDGAVLVLDNASGEVLAWVGSSGTLSQAGEVDGVLALRQPGSTLKPFLYAQALAEKRLTAASLIEDSPAHIPTPGGLYIPQNYDRRFKGWVPVRTALAASLNVPAVRTLAMVSPDAFFAQLRALGLPLRESGSYYGYSLALGSAEVPLLQLTNAYRALANGGCWRPVAEAARSRPACQPALDARAAFIVGDILSDGNARAPTFGTDSVLATRFWTAVKTGTSKDMRDNWAVGWSRHYTVGVWVGNAGGAAMHGVSGSSGAAPVWAEVMAHLHAARPSRAPAPPPALAGQPALVHAAVRYGPDPATGEPLSAARSEWFLPGTQQALFALEQGGAQAAPGRILRPAPGTIVALDPDIPPERQRLQFAAQLPSGDARALRWWLDGKEVARGAHWSWLPWPGRHRMELRDAEGAVLDSVAFEVRGARVR
ncbi:penicillin-binding protein 1C [Comamonas endophytica]|uniref:peptidoglycan glycosyltransferase n=1 Tax=Comamonas endophytica TaxID=2949090 RepID=A0ABY6GBS1_9BURK|nr:MULTISPECIES: penicillin-binding protein 1C [unclassified Acidovorax]MCD2513487.1 penicillin-binding protein 1C [Acidovorax sp. D4N7]UYG52498.1 penicillin-binding protein 1C [Acidovorax sp. 5MLIR]